MTDKELLQELHLALEGAVDQLVRTQRLMTVQELPVKEWSERADRLLADTVALRNDVREKLMTVLARRLPVVTE